MYYEPIILSQFHREFTISFGIMLWILYLVTKTLWIHNLFPELTMNLRSVMRVHYEFHNFFRNHYELNIFSRFYFFSRLYFLFRGIIMNPHSFFTKIISLIRDFTISFVNLLFFTSWELIYYLFGSSLLIYHISHRLSVTRNHYKFIISRELIHVSWYFSGNHYGFIIFFVKSLWFTITYANLLPVLRIHYMLREFTIDPLFISRINV